MDVMVLHAGVVGVVELPSQVAVPVVLLDPTSFPAAGEHVVVHETAAQQAAVFEQVGGLAGHVAARPGVAELAFIIDEIGLRVVFGREQGIADRRPRIVDEQADGLLQGSKRERYYHEQQDE
jgi:hypothetical protein